MLSNFFRAIIIYIFVLLVMRLMGKREIGQLQPFELAILGLLVMHLLISVLNMKSLKFREIICGKPSILIYRGRIDEKILKKERFTINELEERLRSNNIFNIGDVEYAILETSGQITVIPKPEKRNVVVKDFNLEPEYEGIS